MFYPFRLVVDINSPERDRIAVCQGCGHVIKLATITVPVAVLVREHRLVCSC